MKDLQLLLQGQPVLVRDWQNHHRQWRTSVVDKQLSDRSYSLFSDNDIICRNRKDIRPLELMSADHQLAHTQETKVASSVEKEAPKYATNEKISDTRRSQCPRKSPRYLQDYVT